MREAKLNNILPSTKDKKITLYLIRPDYTKDDHEINGIKRYLVNNIASSWRGIHP
jgi:hypothetical protein